MIPFKMTLNNFTELQVSFTFSVTIVQEDFGGKQKDDLK